MRLPINAGFGFSHNSKQIMAISYMHLNSQALGYASKLFKMMLSK